MILIGNSVSSISRCYFAKGVVHMPSGRIGEPNIINNGDGTISISYTPTEAGLHEMDILFDKEHIPGSPVQFYVDAIAPGHVTAFGPGLVTGRVDKPAEFTVVTKDAGAGLCKLIVSSNCNRMKLRFHLV